MELARLGRDEPLDELERGLRDLLPAVVDGQRVAAVGHLLDLRDARVAFLPLVGGVGDRPGNRVVLLPVEDQQRAPSGWVLAALAKPGASSNAARPGSARAAVHVLSPRVRSIARSPAIAEGART